MSATAIALRLTLPAPPLRLRLVDSASAPPGSPDKPGNAVREESMLDTIRVGTEHFARAARLMWENPLNDF